MNKPTGQYRCLSCNRVWDEHQIIIRRNGTAVNKLCGNFPCGGVVEEIGTAVDDKPQVIGDWNWDVIGFPGKKKKRR